MGMLSCYRHVSIIWLMALLVLFAAFAPTVSRIIASNDVVGGIWVEVCSASGTKLVQVDTQEGSTEQPASIQVDHCPFCLPQFQFRAVPALGIALPAGHEFIPIAPSASVFRGQDIYCDRGGPNSRQGQEQGQR